MITLFQRPRTANSPSNPHGLIPMRITASGSGIGSGKHTDAELRRGRPLGVPPADSGGNRITATGTPPELLVTGVSPAPEEIRGKHDHAAAPVTTCRSRHAGRRTRRALLGEASPVFAGSGSSASGENLSAPPASGWARGRADSAEERWSAAGPRRLPACVRWSGRDEARRPAAYRMRRITRRGGNGKLRLSAAPSPSGKLQEATAVPIKENSSRQNKIQKAGGGGLPDICGISHAVRIHRDDRISTTRCIF